MPVKRPVPPPSQIKEILDEAKQNGQVLWTDEKREAMRCLSPQDVLGTRTIVRSGFVLLLARSVAVPIMVLLYLGLAAPLALVYAMDWAFDFVGDCVSIDTRFFPLPRGQDEDFRFRKWSKAVVDDSWDRCNHCGLKQASCNKCEGGEVCH